MITHGVPVEVPGFTGATVPCECEGCPACRPDEPVLPPPPTAVVVRCPGCELYEPEVTERDVIAKIAVNIYHLEQLKDEYSQLSPEEKGRLPESIRRFFEG